MMNVYGVHESLVLFADDTNGVVIDKDVNLIVETGDATTLLASRRWLECKEELAASVTDLAHGALTSLDIKIVASAGRLYTIPKGVQNEAKKALEWRKEEKRGGTPVGLNTARTLAAGGQIGLQKVRHIAKYFPRHEVDKKGKGWEPGEDNFPSNGRIAWALWGGDAGWRWAQAIVERENKKSLTADGYAAYGYEANYGDYETSPRDGADLDAFKLAFELDENQGPEFICRVRLDGSGIDRLYKVDFDGMVYLWDGQGWDDMGHVDGDIYAYDRALDDPYDTTQKDHIIIDPASAIIISARLQQTPFDRVSISDIDQDEAELVANAISEVDWNMVDYAMTASAEFADATTPTDGYTPEERAENAARQVRDANGRFAAQGSRVVINGDTSSAGIGYIRAINPDTQTVSVLLDNGNTVEVAGNTTEKASNYIPELVYDTADVPPLDTTGILGQPRVPIDRPNAQIPGTLPALTANDLQSVLYNWPAWVKNQRDNYIPLGTPAASTTATPTRPVGDEATPFKTRQAQISETTRAFLKSIGAKLTLDAYTDPDLKGFLNKKVVGKDGKTTYPNRLWYQPVTSVLKEITAAATDNKEITPDTSDVVPLFMAIVSPDDPRAVLDLVSLVPAGTKLNAPMTFKRVEGKWVKDEGILADLNSATPPPVVPLDGETYANVLEQVDGTAPIADEQAPATETKSDEAPVLASVELSMDQMLMVLWGPKASIIEPEARKRMLIEQLLDGDDLEASDENEDELDGLFAAGGLDRNRGQAEKLRRYWLYGKGAAKIRWNTNGDWTRCVRYLSKYMGPRSKGYCALRHKEATGLWTGDKMHRQLYGRKGGRNSFSSDMIAPMENVIEHAVMIARANDARARMGMTAGATEECGAKFRIPLVIPEGIESGDGRIFERGVIDIRELPLPLMWQIKTGDGHSGSVVVGRIDHMERTEDGIGNATGVFDKGAYGQEAERLVRNGFIRGVSADMDKFEAEEEEAAKDDNEKVVNGKLNITQARVMGVTIVPKPAFQECSIFIVEDNEETQEQEDSVIPDGVYVEDVDPVEAAALVACGFVAGAIPVVPPRGWFDNPELKKATPLTVTDDGQVFGHIAAWHVDHIGMSYGTKPPRSKSKYAYFHTGVIRTDDSTDIPVGQLTLAGGHASLEASAVEAARHYDDTASAIADVHAGEDAYGIWVAGALRPGTTPEQVRALRASAPSGDWRPIKGSLELVAVCQVNVPGFPIARARVASGQVMALVAAGANTLARMKSDPVAELTARVQKLEQLEDQALSVKADAARARFEGVRAERRAELQARAAELSNRVFADVEYEDGFGYVSRETRQKLAKEGKALPDGSFPITNLDSLKDSIQAYGRGKKSKRAAIRRHIMKRARQLGKPELIPDQWKTAASDEISAQLSTIREKIATFTTDAPAPTAEEAEGLGKVSAVEFAEPEAKYISGKTQPRDAKGKFRQVLARLKQDLGDSGLNDVVKKIEDTENLDDAGNYIEAARSATDLIGIVDRIDSRALNPDALVNVRESARQLGETIANLPLPFGADAEKVRFSDLPPALKDLVDDMISRVEEKIGKDEADVATENIRKFMAGGDYLNQSQVSSELSKLLRLLT
jgi:hypothetical protein